MTFHVLNARNPCGQILHRVRRTHRGKPRNVVEPMDLAAFCADEFGLKIRV